MRKILSLRSLFCFIDNDFLLHGNILAALLQNGPCG
jgi:hypothetical protein